MAFIDEEMSLIHSYNIPIIKNVSTFFIANSIALVETGKHWIVIGYTEEKEEIMTLGLPMALFMNILV